MRAGRFDRQIFVDLPDIRERAEIFKASCTIEKVEGLDTEFLAKQTQDSQSRYTTFVMKRHCRQIQQNCC
jgi:ATP-dependent Zn protease